LSAGRALLFIINSATISGHSRVLFTLAKLNVYTLYAWHMNSLIYGYSFETLLNNIKSNKSQSAPHPGVSRSSSGGGHRGGVDHHPAKAAGCGLASSSHPAI
jgi:hypothetical protein